MEVSGQRAVHGCDVRHSSDDTSGGPLQYFTPPPAGSFDVPPRPGVGGNSFRGPGYFAVDATLVKQFRFPIIPGLGNDAGLEIRANAFNLFNNLNLEA